MLSFSSLHGAEIFVERPNNSSSADSTVVAGGLPEFGPGLAQGMTDENIRVIDGLFVFDAELVPGVRCKPAGNEYLLQVIKMLAQRNNRLRRRIPVAALPEGIYAAEHARQPVLWTIEIDGARFAIVRSENSEVRTVFGGKRIANFCHSFD